MATKKRIGSSMRAAVEFVRLNPNCAKLPAAEACGAHGSRKHGYAAVDRAIKAGLILAAPGARRGWYSLTVAEEVAP